MWLLNSELIHKIYPRFWDQFYEYTEIQRAQENNLKIFNEETEKMLYNQFISTADEIGISQFEYILHIQPKTTDSLESRRERVAARWKVEPPFTENFVKKWLDEYIGIGNWEYLKDYPHFNFTITTYNTDSIQNYEIDNFIFKVKPANMIYNRKAIVFNPAGSKQFGYVKSAVRTKYPWVG